MYTRTEDYCLHHYSEQLTRTFAVLVNANQIKMNHSCNQKWSSCPLIGHDALSLVIMSSDWSSCPLMGHHTL